jgi:hypothetical protein
MRPMACQSARAAVVCACMRMRMCACRRVAPVRTWPTRQTKADYRYRSTRHEALAVPGPDERRGCTCAAPSLREQAAAERCAAAKNRYADRGFLGANGFFRRRVLGTRARPRAPLKLGTVGVFGTSVRVPPGALVTGAGSVGAAG